MKANNYRSGKSGLKMKNKINLIFLVALLLLSSVALAYRNQAHTQTNPTPISTVYSQWDDIEIRSPEEMKKSFEDKIKEGVYKFLYHYYMHTQTSPVPVSADLKDKNIGLVYIKEGRFEGRRKKHRSVADIVAIDFFEGTQTSSKGFSLNSNDEVCVGDIIEVVNSGLEGEWYTKGGDIDSPPVLWVENLTEVVDKINKEKFSTDVHRAFICTFAFPDFEGPKECLVDAQVICESSCWLSVEGPVERDGNRIKVTGEGEINITAACIPQCIMFVDRKAQTYFWQPRGAEVYQRELYLPSAYGYMVFCPHVDDPYEYDINEQCTLSLSILGYEASLGNTKTLDELKETLDNLMGVEEVEFTYDLFTEEWYKPPVIIKSFTITARQMTKGPKIQIKIYLPQDLSSKSSKFIVRLEVKNTGDTTAYIEKVEVTNADFKVLYSPEKIEPGEKKEILLEVMPASIGDIDFKIEYYAENLGCLNQRTHSTYVNLIAGSDIDIHPCISDSDCSIGETCCVGSCRPSAKGACDDIDGDGVPDTWVEI